MKTYKDLLYISKVKTNQRDFGNKVIEISNDLDINPDWLMAVMYKESKIDYKIQNKDTNATGLIQFMPNTAKDLGTDVNALIAMGPIRQLDFVKKYFWRYKNNLVSYPDLYRATFFPLSLGKSKDFVMETRSLKASLIAKQNPAIDKWPKDGKITNEEFDEYVYAGLPASLAESFRRENRDSIFKMAGRNIWQIVGGVIVLAAAGYIYMKKIR